MYVNKLLCTKCFVRIRVHVAKTLEIFRPYSKMFPTETFDGPLQGFEYPAQPLPDPRHYAICIVPEFPFLLSTF